MKENFESVSDSSKEKEPHIIFHVTSRTLWEDALKSGMYSGDRFDEDGFIHCSDANQIGKIGDFFLKNRGGDDMLVLEIDTSKVNAEIKYEGREELYPHIYGPINADSVVSVRELREEPK